MEDFEKYIRNDINPFGLRIQIFPLIENISPEFKIKWENNLQLCIRNMMQLLVEEYRARTPTLEKDIDHIYSKLQPFKSLSAFKDQEKRIKNHLDQVTVDILRKKKFWRDKMAFEQGKAYKWQQNSNPLGHRTKGLNTSIAERGPNFSINSSASSSSRNRSRPRHKPAKRPLSGDDSNTQKKQITDTASSSTPSVSGMSGNHTLTATRGDIPTSLFGTIGGGSVSSQHGGMPLTQSSNGTGTG